MKILLFGATGMIGQGVLRQCLLDPEVESVLCPVRAPTGQSHAKLKELVHPNFFDYSDIEAELGACDACLFCLGVSSAGMKEADYRRVTYDLTLAAANTLARRNPKMTFIYVSGASTDSTEKGRSMWARVKGQTENAILALPFAHKYMFRPAFIQPMHGIVSKTRLYRIIYLITAPLYPLWKRLIPRFVTSTDEVARAMIEVAKHGAAQPIVENPDINRIAAAIH
jgi:uncharacterized protein YbjT (DUF2867 family)